MLIPSPAGPIPTPIPHPHVGMLFDPLDFVPMVGTAVKVNGMPRAVAGTAGMAMPPHIPMGGTFAKPPGNESEMFMGSMTVQADGDPLSYAGELLQRGYSKHSVWLHESPPLEVLEILARDVDPAVRSAVADKRAAAPLLVTLAMDAHASVRARVACNHNARASFSKVS